MYSPPVGYKRRIDCFAVERPISRLSVLVAIYNEIDFLEDSLRSLWSTLSSIDCEFEIIVVESNSSDGSRDLILRLQNQLDLQLFLQDSPQGKGSAIRLAMSKMSGDVFLIYDADLEYDSRDIPRLLEPIESGKSSFILGTRHSAGQAMRVMDKHRVRPFIMNQAHFFFTSLLNLFLKEKMTDPFTMYKVFRSEVFSGVALRSNRFDLDWELVIKAVRRGSRPFEVPVIYKSRSFDEGKKVSFFRDPILWIIALFRFRFFERI